jgi:hypothetical protein
MARSDLLDGVADLARRRGVSLYKLVNDTFDLVLRAERLGLDLEAILEGRDLLRRARESGFIPVLEGLWYEIAEIAYEKERERALRIWSEAGGWLARVYLSKDLKDPFGAFERDMKELTWSALEFDVERDGGLHVRVVSPRFSEAYAHLFCALLEGALGAFGYTPVEREVSKGTIRLRAAKGGADAGEKGKE